MPAQKSISKNKCHNAVTLAQWIEPWYLVYAVQGALVAGLLPILLPLAVTMRECR